MSAITTVSNTRNELRIAKIHLNDLMSKKEEIYSKYFPVTPRYSENVGGNHDSYKDNKMALYVAEINDINERTGKSLSEEIVIAQAEVNKLQATLDSMLEVLATLKGIEYELYYAIVGLGYRPAQAVRYIAEKYDKDDSTIWKYNYKKIKKYV